VKNNNYESSGSEKRYEERRAAKISFTRVK
jgi:hypothetical protein